VIARARALRPGKPLTQVINTHHHFDHSGGILADQIAEPSRSKSSRTSSPGLRHLTGRARRAQLDGYIARIVERDFEDLGHRIRNPAALRRWMAAYAAATSTTASYETIRDAATGGEADKPAKTTTQPYRDTLERLRVIDPVPAWQPVRNPITRLTAPPKHHLPIRHWPLGFSAPMSRRCSTLGLWGLLFPGTGRSSVTSSSPW